MFFLPKSTTRRDQPKNPYRSRFAPLILSYSEPCWAYSPFNVFRRAILIGLPSIPTEELSIRATLSSFTMGSLICAHCYLMLFKWSKPKPEMEVGAGRRRTSRW